ncbi:MAG: hypothetical protein QW828_02290 [Candidatus Bathyarchaeia archaeon]
MRVIVGLALILVFVWMTMLAGLVVIFVSLPFLASSLSARVGRLLESIAVSGVASLMVLAWLIVWKRLAFRFFFSLLSRRPDAC